MTALLRTIVIDSDEDSRINLKSILAGMPSVIVGEFRNIAEALRTAPAYRPDVVIVEIPVEHGSDGDAASSTIEHLARVLPDASILATGPTQSAHLVIQVMRAGAIDFVADISAPFNAAILGSMFGVPEQDFIDLRHWLDDFFKREKPPAGEEPKQVVAMRELRRYLGAHAEQRLTKPGDDLMSAMLQAEEDGKKLTMEQVVITTMTFFTAGFESTNNLFTNLTHALSLHPRVLEEVRAHPDLIPAFVEEGMRWDAAAQGFVRSPTHDVTLHGKVIPQGAQVLLHIGSANRDEREFAEADRFDIHRSDQRHLGMGQGIHFCVGAPLGRAMAQFLFEELLPLSARWDVDLRGAARVTTPNFRGFVRLPLTLA